MGEFRMGNVFAWGMPTVHTKALIDSGLKRKWVRTSAWGRRKCKPSSQSTVRKAFFFLHRLRQPSFFWPKLVDSSHDSVEFIPLCGLPEETIRVKLIAYQYIRLRLGGGQDDGRDTFQAVIRLDEGQHLAPIHFRKF